MKDSTSKARAKENRRSERRERFLTDSGIELKRFYTPQDLKERGWSYEERLGYPGEYPYTRGIYPTMYRGRLWTMRQYAGFGTAEETNRRYRYLIEQGQMGLSVAFDLPTQMGYDADHPLAEGEVGKAGVSICSLEDMERLFEGIPLDRISTSMTINAPAAVLLAMYIAVGEERGVPPSQLAGTTQNDVLKEFIARKTYIFPPGPSLRLATDVILYCAERLPKWNPISISGYHMREAGATAAQEIAFTLADAICYVEAVLERGMEVDQFAPQLSFFFSCDRHFLEEIAKFRAARRLWAQIMKERFGAKNPRSWMLRFHTQTAGSSLTAQQPVNNVIRTAIEALAAVLGGTQSLHTNAYDEALALPTEESVLLALRTQQVLAEESGAADTIDPVGGAYAIEALTDELEARARDYIEKIDRMGGMLRAIETGYVQREIEESAYRKQQEVERGERLIVGVNCFLTEEEGKPRVLKVPPEVRERQVERLRALRERRDARRVSEALAHLKDTAADEEANLMQSIVEAVKARATVGEICDALREVFGTYEEPGTF